MDGTKITVCYHFVKDLHKTDIRVLRIYRADFFSVWYIQWSMEQQLRISADTSTTRNDRNML